MVLQNFTIMGLKAQITPVAEEDESFERNWTVEEMADVIALMLEDKPNTFDKLPQSAQDKQMEFLMNLQRRKLLQNIEYGGTTLVVIPYEKLQRIGNLEHQLINQHMTQIILQHMQFWIVKLM